MALIQLEVLMVTLHRISCLLVSVQREHLPACFLPFMEENPLWAIYPNKPLNAFIFTFFFGYEFSSYETKCWVSPIPSLTPNSQISPCCEGISVASEIYK